eukprot:GGOE01022173.1.p1 GENE.GGOE01022173.1~~GGOE01022173.1.p1  ORF type:complete len:727 (+),score=184.60 GGOE01022173.1:58-2181(+)
MGNGGISARKAHRRSMGVIAVQNKVDAGDDCQPNVCHMPDAMPAVAPKDCERAFFTGSHVSKIRQLSRSWTPPMELPPLSVRTLSPPPALCKVTVKATLQSLNSRRGDTRKFPLPIAAEGSPRGLSFDALMAAIREKFSDRLSSGQILVKYKDEENDFITLVGQPDFNDLFRLSVERCCFAQEAADGPDSDQVPVVLRVYVECLEDPTSSRSPLTNRCSKGRGSWTSEGMPTPTVCDLDVPPLANKPCRLRRSPMNSARLRKSRSTSAISDDCSTHLNAGEFLSHHLGGQQPRRWTVGRLLGSGGCAKVYRAMYTDNGQLMAVKQVQIQKHPNVQEDLINLDREVSALKTLNHPMIVQYLGIEIEEREDQEFTVVNILMELVGGASIACLLHEMGPFSEEVCQSYTAQILIGLEYLHGKGIVHRDIKGANILVDRRGNIKLTDFGASKRIVDLITKSEGASELKGTIKWMAPEVCLGNGGCKASDVWSLGCTVVEMLTGDSPFPGIDQFSLLFNVAMGKCEPLVPEAVSAECKAFLWQCFKPDPADRPAVSSLSRHPWLNNIHPSSASETTETDKLTSELSSTYSGPPSSRFLQGEATTPEKLDLRFLPPGLGYLRARDLSQSTLESEGGSQHPSPVQKVPWVGWDSDLGSPLLSLGNTAPVVTVESTEIKASPSFNTARRHSEVPSLPTLSTLAPVVQKASAPLLA